MAVLGHVLGWCLGGGGFHRKSLAGEKTADPSTTLRSGRDDKGEGGAFIESRIVDERTAVPLLKQSAPTGRLGAVFCFGEEVGIGWFGAGFAQGSLIEEEGGSEDDEAGGNQFAFEDPD